MIITRRKLDLWERLYLPAIWGGFKVTIRHFFKKKVTMQFPEEKWVVPEGYRGAPYLVLADEMNEGRRRLSTSAAGVRSGTGPLIRSRKGWE